MKPPVFDYYDPDTEAETLSLLAQFGSDAKLLAGGQSLMPMLNMRLVEPAQIIDVNRLRTLSYIRATPTTLHLGALCRQYEVETAPDVAEYCPLLGEAIRQVGYPQIRYRGTIGGSLVHADPAAELPAVMTALEAEFEVQSTRGSRLLNTETFFASYLMTTVAPDELLCEVRLPIHLGRTGTSFLEVARVAGAFAIVGAAAVVTLDEAGRCRQARLAFTGVGPVPHRATVTEAVLQGEELSELMLDQAAQLASNGMEPDSDVHGSAAYRCQLARVLARRSLMQAWQRALSC